MSLQSVVLPVSLAVNNVYRGSNHILTNVQTDVLSCFTLNPIFDESLQVCNKILYLYKAGEKTDQVIKQFLLDIC